TCDARLWSDALVERALFLQPEEKSAVARGSLAAGCRRPSGRDATRLEDVAGLQCRFPRGPVGSGPLHARQTLRPARTRHHQAALGFDGAPPCTPATSASSRAA